MTLPLAAIILAVTLFSEPVEVLVLRGGHEIAIDGRVELDGDRAIFRDRSGGLYSIPVTEVDVDATIGRAELAARRDAEASASAIRKLPVSDEEKTRLLRDLERRIGPRALPPPVTEVEVAAQREPRPRREPDRHEERRWRDAARQHDEAVRRAEEEIELLEDRLRRLESKIITLLGQGFEPSDFSLDTFRLEQTREALDRARLSLERAERARAQFRDDARREGILPGWLR